MYGLRSICRDREGLRAYFLNPKALLLEFNKAVKCARMVKVIAAEAKAPPAAGAPATAAAAAAAATAAAVPLRMRLRLLWSYCGGGSPRVLVLRPA